MTNRSPAIVPETFPAPRPRWGQERRFDRTRYFFELVGRYFLSREAWVAWPLLLLAFGHQFASVYVQLLNAKFEKMLLDVIGARQADRLPSVILTFVVIAVLMSGMGQLGELFRGSLSIRWRRWLVEDFTGRWLANGHFRDIERNALADNPDQRMTEDITLFVDSALIMLLGATYTFVGAISFGMILWNLSGDLDLRGFGIPLVLHGSLVWMAIVYTLLGTIVLAFLGRPLVRRTMKQQHYEADFRFALVAIRRNVEQIALARLAKGEWGRLVSLYATVKRNFMSVLFVKAAVSFCSQLFMHLKSVLPIAIALPRYFAGQISIGDIALTRNAFGTFGSSLSFFITAYPTTVVQALSALNRLRTLDMMIERERAPGIEVVDAAQPAIAVRDLSLRLPAGAPLATIGDWTVEPGSRWIVRGPSGVGKSSLLRAVAGIWPDGSGTIALPADARVLFLPQQPYLGGGTLRAVLSFPREPDAFTHAALADVLHRAMLGTFADRIDEPQNWGETMSPGEQQRIGFARILLHEPTHLFLDEATSALDEEAADAMYRLVAEQAGLTIVSVVHTDALDTYHDHILRIGDGRATQGLLGHHSGERRS